MTLASKITLVRVAFIPLFMIFMYLSGGYAGLWMWLSLGVFIIASLTDYVDGQIARKRNQVSDFGKFLDPLADKLTQLSLIICLSIRYPVLRGVLILFVIKELFQVSSVCILFRRGRVLPGALFAGKLCTTVLFVSFTVLILIPDLPTKIVTAAAILDAAFLAYSFISYFLAFFGKNHKLQDIQE